MTTDTGRGMKGKGRGPGEHRNKPRSQRAASDRFKAVQVGPCAKRAYRDKTAAKVVLKAAQATRRREGTAAVKCEQRVYRCDVCQLWHLTSLSVAAAERVKLKRLLKLQRVHGAGGGA